MNFTQQTQIDSRRRIRRFKSPKVFRSNLKTQTPTAQPRQAADRGHEEGRAGTQPRPRRQEGRGRTQGSYSTLKKIINYFRRILSILKIYYLETIQL